MKNLIEKMFGTKHERDVKKMQPLVVEINNYFEKLKSLSDEELQAKTDEFKTRLAEGETVGCVAAISDRDRLERVNHDRRSQPHLLDCAYLFIARIGLGLQSKG